MPGVMSQNDTTQDPQSNPGQTQPETGIEQDPSTNTAPPSNPPTDRDAVEKGKEKLDSIVNW